MSGVCDLCAARLGADAVEVSPVEMRIIAGNGYGVHVPVWSTLSREERRAKLYQLAMYNDTAWALCRACFERTREYAADRGGGPSDEEFREVALKPLLEALGGGPPARAEPSAAPSPSLAPTFVPASVRCLAGHTERVMSVAVTPDGRRALSGGWDRTVRLWDLQSGKETHCLTGHTGFVTSVAFLGDGRRAISAGAGDCALRMWDCEAGREMLRLRKHSFTIHQLDASADGRLVVTASGDCTARLWDTTSGSHVRKLGGFFGGTHADAVTAAALSADGTRALTGSLNAEVKLWEAATARILHSFKGFPYGIGGLAFLPDGRRAFVVSGEAPRVLDLLTGRDDGAFANDAKGWKDLAISADGRRIVVADNWNGLFVRVLDLATGRALRTFEGHTKDVTSVAISADGRRVVSGSDDGSVRVWEA